MSTTDYGDVVSGAMADGAGARPRVAASVTGPQLELTAQPILSTAGGKRRLVPALMQHLPAGGFARYLEPFCGGAALFLALAPRDGAVLSDVNVEIVELYAALVHDVERVIRSLSGHVEAHERNFKCHYYLMRDVFNDETAEIDACERAALVLDLNRACFNGLYRVNRRGKFNGPAGRAAGGGPKRVVVGADGLRAAAALFARAQLVACDFASAMAIAQAGDLIFCDPPYDSVGSVGSFASYTPGGFGPDEQARLEHVARRAAQRGARVLLSNADTPLVRELYRDRAIWRISEVMAPRSVAASGAKRKRAAELLISSYEPRGAAS